MSDRKLYYEDPALDRVDTQVIEAGIEDGQPFVRLSETVFYPAGGGQPSDHGTIAGVPVMDVRSRGDQVLHLLERPLAPGPVTAAIDARRRFDFRQQHTAQHLLSAILDDRHRLATTSFHLGDEYTAIEVAGAVPTSAQLERFESEVNAEIRRNRPVRIRQVQPDELAELEVRTRGLPAGHSGPVRLVEIEGIDLNTCGGTHVGSLAEIQIVHLLDASPARGGARIRFLAGARTLRQLRRGELLEAELRGRLGTGPEEFATVLDGWSEERRRTERQIRELSLRLAEARSGAIASQPGTLLLARVEGAGPESLRLLAAAVLARRPDAIVALVGDLPDSPEACFVVQSGPDGPAEVAEIGSKLCAALGGRGGGRGRVFQGKGGRYTEEAFAGIPKPA